MAIVQEHFWIGDKEYVRTYSNAGYKVHGGFPEGDYDELEDPADMNRTYTETNIHTGEASEAEEILDILMGVEE